MTKFPDDFPKLSVVIACYNDRFVSRAIESAKNLDYSNKEIIVIDDGSDAETKAVIASSVNDIDLLIEQENRGQSIARNAGIAKANGEYILNLDSDDHFESSFARKAIEKFETDGSVKIVTCKARRFDQNGTIDIFTPKGGEIESFLFSNSALGSSMFRKKDWEACGGYEEELPILGFEDWEFYIQLLKDGGYAHVIPEVLFHYHVRAGNTTSRIKHEKQDKFREIILKHPELYKENFEVLVQDLFSRIKHSEFQKHKIKGSLDFKTGKFILKPLRHLRSFFRSSKR